MTSKFTPRKALDELLNKPEVKMEGREASHSKHQQFSLNVVLDNRNQSGMLYGLLLSAPFYNPSRGIQFVFEGWHIKEWDNPVNGVFLVSITGYDLGDIANHIKEATLDRIVIGDNITGFEVQKIEVGK